MAKKTAKNTKPTGPQERIGPVDSATLKSRAKMLDRLAKRLSVYAAIMDKHGISEVDAIDGATAFSRSEAQLRRWANRIRDRLEDAIPEIGDMESLEPPQP